MTNTMEEMHLEIGSYSFDWAVANTIFSHLIVDSTNIGSAMLVCKSWHQYLDCNEVIWQQLAARQWPLVLEAGTIEAAARAGKTYRTICRDLSSGDLELRRYLADLQTNPLYIGRGFTLPPSIGTNEDLPTADHELSRLRDPHGTYPCGIGFWAEALRSDMVVNYVVRQIRAVHVPRSPEQMQANEFIEFHGVYEYGAISIARLVTLNLGTRDVDRVDPFWVTGAINKLTQECKRRIDKINSSREDTEDSSEHQQFLLKLKVITEVLFSPRGPDEGPSLHPLVPQVCCPLEGYGLGLQGDADDFYYSANSCLDAVLLRRRGIPITLSLLFYAIARRLDVDVRMTNTAGRVLAAGPFDPSGVREVRFFDAFLGGKLLQVSKMVPANYNPPPGLEEEIVLTEAAINALHLSASKCHSRMLLNLRDEARISLPFPHELQIRLSQVIARLGHLPDFPRQMFSPGQLASAAKVSSPFPYERASLQQPKFCPAVVRFRVGQAVKATLADHSEIGVVLDRLIIGKEEEIDLESLPRYMERENIPHHLHVSIMAAAPDRVLLNYPPQPDSSPMGEPQSSKERVFCILLVLPEIYLLLADITLGMNHNVMVVDQDVLETHRIPSPSEVTCPELAWQLEMLDRSCGRYFVRRSEDGSYYVPSAVVEARFPEG